MVCQHDQVLSSSTALLPTFCATAQVVVSEATLTAMAAARAAGRPLWRVSSTTFVHLASDGTLRPLGAFATPEARCRIDINVTREAVDLIADSVIIWLLEFS